MGVRKCNESGHPDETIPLFVTFRYILAPEQHFRYTTTIFVTPNECVRSVTFENARARQQRPEHRRGAASDLL